VRAESALGSLTPETPAALRDDRWPRGCRALPICFRTCSTSIKVEMAPI
jgi:hypothetical protein